MNASSNTRRQKFTVIEGGLGRDRRREDELEPVVHCYEGGWRSSWHERMEDDEAAYEELAFGRDAAGA